MILWIFSSNFGMSGFLQRVPKFHFTLSPQPCPHHMHTRCMPLETANLLILGHFSVRHRAKEGLTGPAGESWYGVPNGGFLGEAGGGGDTLLYCEDVRDWCVRLPASTNEVLHPRYVVSLVSICTALCTARGAYLILHKNILTPPWYHALTPLGTPLSPLLCTPFAFFRGTPFSSLLALRSYPSYVDILHRAPF